MCSLLSDAAPSAQAKEIAARRKVKLELEMINQDDPATCSPQVQCATTLHKVQTYCEGFAINYWLALQENKLSLPPSSTRNSCSRHMQQHADVHCIGLVFAPNSATHLEQRHVGIASSC